MTALSFGWQHQFVETNHIRLHCVTQGEGDLVILLHGFPEFWYSWRFQIPALAKHFKVVAPDLRGYNDSDKPLSGYDLDTLAADIHGLIRSLGYQRAYVVGHDWGGAIAWHLAHQFPQMIQRLAILNAPHPYRFVRDMFSNVEQLRRSWYVFALQVPALPEWLVQQNLSRVIKAVFHDQAIRKGAFSARDTEIYEAALEKPGVLKAAFSYYRQMLAPQYWFKAMGRSPALISAPTLVLWGEEDPFLTQTLTQGMEQFVAAPFHLRLVPDCGHWIQQEVPQTVNRELIQFLRQSE